MYVGGNPKVSVKSELPAAFKKIEDNLASNFSTKVKLAHSKKVMVALHSNIFL